MGLFLPGQRQVDVIPAGSDEVFPTGGVSAGFFFAPEPRVVGFGAVGLGAAVFIFEFERNRAEKTGSTFANTPCQEERADVLTDAVVDVGMPALGLFFEGLPADEDVKRSIAFEYGGQLGLEGTGSP